MSNPDRHLKYSLQVMTSTITASRRSSGARLRIDTTLPSISVVIASNGSLAQLSRCLEAFVSATGRLKAEIVVARAGESTELDALRHLLPSATYVTATRGTSRAELRSLGMANTTGDVVALLDDDRVIDSSWFQQMQYGTRRGVTGAIASVVGPE